MYKQTLCLSDLLANKNVNINLKNNFKKNCLFIYYSNLKNIYKILH